ncbi:MAG: CinA family protein [Hydrocarboniphaga sp.]|uniref:CinA family protein n=1 Tax=Hydrocarboniphaga sp. TaxID=2033016 RepID=UPI00260A08E6|nr:CinA family protein [Hydrocarboniphaga sp.]MDB5971554.1 CinA family protein [Hydrocarboniphaga sp.]
MNPSDIPSIVQRIADALIRRDQRLASAESCTGGLVAKLLTDRPGSSAWFERGLITYTNQAKQDLLGVAPAIFRDHGAVSGECVAAMAQGLLERAPVDWALSVSGVAGPGGGSADKPVGTVWLGWAQRGDAASTQRFQFDGDREAVRAAAALQALSGLLQRLAS